MAHDKYSSICNTGLKKYSFAKCILLASVKLLPIQVIKDDCFRQIISSIFFCIFLSATSFAFHEFRPLRSLLPLPLIFTKITLNILSAIRDYWNYWSRVSFNNAYKNSKKYFHFELIPDNPHLLRENISRVGLAFITYSKHTQTKWGYRAK